MYKEHFGLLGCPLDKGILPLYDDGRISELEKRFQWLLDSPGIGVFTGEPGVGKTAALHQFSKTLNPHRYQVVYAQDTDCSRRDLYRNLALDLGLEAAYRRTQLWRDIKAHVEELYEQKQTQIVWIIDEAQNLTPSFFRDFPAFLNFAFDSRDMMTVWLVGHPQLQHILSKACYSALSSRIQVRTHLPPFHEADVFQSLIKHAFKAVGCTQTLLSDSGVELLRQASQGRLRFTGQVLKLALRIAADKKMNHIPDDLLVAAIEASR